MIEYKAKIDNLLENLVRDTGVELENAQRIFVHIIKAYSHFLRVKESDEDIFSIKFLEVPRNVSQERVKEFVLDSIGLYEEFMEEEKTQ